MLLIATAIALLLVSSLAASHNQGPPDIHSGNGYEPVRPVLVPSENKRPDPVRWLQQNSNNKYSVSDSLLPPLPAIGSARRPRAALISLVRNSELAGMMQSMRQLEMRWNRKYQVGPSCSPGFIF
jgi:alpha 1,2-mannosyltransferase